jgi:hypothetical protein
MFTEGSNDQTCLALLSRNPVRMDESGHPRTLLALKHREPTIESCTITNDNLRRLEVSASLSLGEELDGDVLESLEIWLRSSTNVFLTTLGPYDRFRYWRSLVLANVIIQQFSI